MAANPIIAQGAALTIPIGDQPNLSTYPGTGYKRGSGGWDGGAQDVDTFPVSCTWVVDDSGYGVQAQYPANSSYTSGNVNGGPNGWTVSQVDASHLSIGVPSGQTVDQNYAVYYQQSDGSYHYAVFDVAAPAVPRRRAGAIVIA